MKKTPAIEENEPLSEAQKAQYLIDTLCGGSCIAFATSVGISKTSMSKILHGHYSLRRWYNAILNEYPEVSSLWLNTGIGYAGDLSKTEVKAHYERLLAERDATIRTLTEQLRINQRVIDKLMAGEI